MKIVTSFLRDRNTNPKGLKLLYLLPFLRHCELWKEPAPRPPPPEVAPKLYDPKLDYGFFVTIVF